jgi:hypothetical protein
MNDYLWNKTGAPDEEIEELEEALERFRYQSRPFARPHQTHRPRRSSSSKSFDAFAIAASIILLLSAAGLWLATRNPDETLHDSTQKAMAGSRQTNALQGNMNQGDRTSRTAAKVETSAVVDEPASLRRQNFKHTALQRRSVTDSQFARGREQMVRRSERAEGEMTKEKLLLALDIASTKLNFAQRKAQQATNINPIYAP